MTVTLSPAQRAVVDHRGSDLQVIACAGSGKTESISRRVATLIAEGIEPTAIVAFTFTERAASELKERITARVAELLGEPFKDRLGPMFVGTIHAYCFRLLQDHVPKYGSYDVLDENRHAAFLSREYRSLGLSNLGPKHWEPIADFTTTVDVLGNELVDWSHPSLVGTPVGDCLAKYRDALDRFHVMTFSMIIANAVAALEDPATHARVTHSLRHLVVDEYQDINPAQQRLIDLLTMPSPAPHARSAPPVELTVVGDDDQSIYQWRGSEISNIVDFTLRRPSARTVPLDTNRRSRSSIVTTAASFAATIQGRLPKTMQPHRANDPAVPSPVYAFSVETDDDEADVVADTIARLASEGYRYKDIAILFRSVRTSAPRFLAALDARNIPYSCAGRTGLFLQPEIAGLGELFAWLSDSSWQDEAYGANRPANRDTALAPLLAAFPKVAPVSLARYVDDWKAFHERGTRAISLVEDLYKLLAELGVRELDPDTATGAARLGAYARFSEILADFENVHRRGHVETDATGKRAFAGAKDRGKPYLRSLANYLLHWARHAYEDFAGEGGPDLDAVDILTVHQSKGLEWPVVFMPALVKGRFPSGRAGRAQSWLLPVEVFPLATRARYEGSDSEERRLFYVAMTRARDQLYLSAFRKKTNRFQPSVYLQELAPLGVTVAANPLSVPLPGKPSPRPAEAAPRHDLSFSELARFDECGHAYRLASMLGFQPRLVMELGYGKAVHHVLRQVAEHVRATGRVPPRPEIEALVDHEFYVPFASTPGFQQMHGAAHRLVRRYIQDFSEDLRRVWAIERPFALHTPDGVVSGRADVILDEGNAGETQLTIVDYKLAHDPAREARYHLQIQVYAEAGRGEGLAVERGLLHELNSGDRAPVTVDVAATTAARTHMAHLLSELRQGQLDPRPEPGRCGRCELDKLCAHRAP